MNFYVISLRNDRDRNTHINSIRHSLLPELKILEAIDGTTIDPKFINFLLSKGVLTRRITTQYSRGTIGCYLSHVKMWTTIRKHKLQDTVILEDDFTINSDFKSRISDICEELPHDYDICYLFYHPFCYKYYKNFNKFEISDKTTIRHYVPTWGLVGYMLSYRGAVKLLELCNTMSGPVDNMVARNILLGKVRAFHSRELLVDTVGECLYKDKSEIRFKSNASGGGFFI